MTSWYRELFERLGVRYLDYRFTQGTEQEVTFLTEQLRLHPDERILDLACGAGRHSIELARRGFRPVGVDLSARMLQVARACARQHDAKVHLVRADARALPFAGNFDVAFSLCEGAFGILESDADNRRVLSEVHRALRPGGRFLLNALHAAFAFRRPEGDEHLDVERCVGYWTERGVDEQGREFSLACSNRYYTCPEIKLLLEMAGFEVVEIWGALAGSFERRPVRLDDFEMLVLARKPAVGKAE
ncbi:MAG: methyltransferase domain-containing protein [bacterium]|jgi:SAM-dependent methyltransferase|nr:methyltransferase domain-containing protein [candidate division KSB1 bacterium]MDH7559482.1 methyltransferase domain-containing protein [bacterium]